MTTENRTHIADLVAAAQAGDEPAFESLVERYRRELHVHCYRMLGSVDDAEDLVQETFLRAWRGRGGFSFDGNWSFRSWLYRIATNACLDALRSKPRRVLAYQLGPAAKPDDEVPPAAPEIPWLEPYPDHLLDGIAPSDEEPDALVVARETIELAFLAAIQLLPPRQRAVLILRDVLDWSAKETAALLETSVASANSALQRARATLEYELPPRRADWGPPSAPTAEDRAVLERYMDAFERRDAAAVADLFAEDMRAAMPPYPFWFDGRDDNVTAMQPAFDPSSEHYPGEFRCIATAANRQPAAACYVRAPGQSEFRFFAVDVLRIEDGKVAEITAFMDERAYAAFGLPATL